MRERQVEIARRFAAAFISYNLGIKPDYCRKKYFRDDQPIASIWLELARLADERMGAAMDAQPDKRPTEIQ